MPNFAWSVGIYRVPSIGVKMFLGGFFDKRTPAGMLNLMINRRGLRVPTLLRVCYSEPGGETCEGFMAFLGTGGCFILGGDPPDEGTLFRLEFTLPNNSKPIKLAGKVVWRRLEYAGSRQTGFGVEFKTISQKDKESLALYVESVLMRKV